MSKGLIIERANSLEKTSSSTQVQPQRLSQATETGPDQQGSPHQPTVANPAHIAAKTQRGGRNDLSGENRKGTRAHEYSINTEQTPMDWWLDSQDDYAVWMRIHEGSQHRQAGSSGE